MHKHASANRFYRLVWSHVHACWVVVAESARGRGKSNSSVRAARRLGAVLAGAVLAGGALAAPPPAVNALPSGAQLVAGQASIATSGNQMTVTQSSNQAIVNWQSFDIGANAAVRFDQPSASAVALNRVVGSDPSQIYGKLSSNGSVFLINPQGVLFNAGAQVDVGALTASSLGLSDQAFLSGQYDFAGGSSAGAVSNAGRINAAKGGYVALIAPSVSNSGSISAAQGSVALAAGEQVSIDLRGDGLIGVRTTRGALQALAQNSGAISADGGSVLLSATAADALTRATVNNTGIVQARGIVADGGSIRLVADEVYTGALDASSAAGQGGSIAAEGRFVSVDGALKADGASGGSIAVSSSGNLSAAATASAAGRSGAGGVIRYSAGNALVENTGAVTSVDGATDGGSTTLSAGAGLTSSGAHSARGGSGTGGRIDVTAKDVTLFSSTLDASGGAQGGLVRIGGAFQGGNARPDAPDADRFLQRWGQSAAIANADSVFINDSTAIDVSARGTAGQGGTAIVWSQDQTTMLGALKATGAAAGGAVEISSAESLRYVNLDQLALGAGGSLLLDPKNIIITSNAAQWVYSKLLGTDATLEAGDGAGFGVALSADGTQLAVGAPFDGGATIAAQGQTPAQTNPTPNAGAVRLYTFENGNDFSGAALKGTIGSGYTGGGNLNVALAADSLFGAAVALSGDGRVLAVGAPGQYGGAGAVHEYRYAAAGFTTLSDQIDIGSHYNTANVNGAAIAFGSAVALNGDGGKLAVGALYQGNSAGAVYGLNNDFSNHLASVSYTLNGAGSNLFGTAVALDSAGSHLAVGAINENNGSGKVYLYTVSGATTTLGATLSNATTSGINTQVKLLDGEYFGSALAFNAAGTRLAVGAPNAPQYAGPTLGPGSVRIFDFANNSYGSATLASTVGRGYTFAPDGTIGSKSYDNFGFAVALNGAGDRLIVGAPYADDANQSGASGGVYAFALQSGGSAVPDLGYVEPGASSGTTLISAGSLAGLLNLGSKVTLQASNDITLNAGADIATTGSLTLEAGRSIVLNSKVSLFGSDSSLVLTANASKPNANTGPVDKDRDSGTAVLTVNADLSATKDISLTLDQAGSFKTNTASGALTINAAVNGGNSVQVRNLGAKSGNDVVFGTTGRLASGGSGDAIVVVSKGLGKFTNNNGTNALTLGGSGRYLVYSSDPSLTLENTSSSYKKHYAQSYTGTTPAYAASGNWFLYSVAPTLTVTATTSTKTYDGVIGGITYTATGYIDGDTAAKALSGELGLVNGSKNVGVYNVNQGSLADAMGYTLTFVANSAKQTVTKAALNVNVNGIDKTYDAGTAATVNYTSNAVAGDAISLAGSASFTDKNAASGKTVNVTGISMSGADAGNYTLSASTGSTTAAITPRALAITATGSGKTYDGLASASATLADDRLGGDVLTVDSSGASYADKNVGVGKTITVNGLSLSGTDAGNYALATDHASATGTITARSLSVGAAGSNKVYDGNASAVVTLSDNRIDGDTLTLSSTSASYNNKNAANGKTISVAGIALGGADAGNYTLASATATTSGNITARTLNATATGSDKIYDGTTAAAVTWSDDRIGGDVLSLTGSAAYADKNVGIGKDITVTGMGLTGAGAGNYVLASNTAHASGDITARTLTVTTSGNTKVYDGTTTAAITLSDNHLSGDQLTVISTGATYSDKNAGTGKSIAINGLSLSGVDADNYVLAPGSAVGSGDITARALVIAATGVNKVYDGGTSATVSYSDNRVQGDNVGFTASAAFDDKNAGTGKTISIGGITLTGADAGNYSLAGTSATTSANISQRTLTATASSSGKVYDGTTSAIATLGDDRIDGDQLTLNTSGSAAYANKNAGVNKTITIGGLSLAGADAGNYVLASSTASGTATIAPKTVTVSVSGSDKVYDGSTAATVSYSESDHVAGDTIAVSGSAAFSDKNAGAGKTINISNLTLGGNDAGNYVLASNSASTTASISARALTVAIASAGKVYDGTTEAVVTLSDDRVDGDRLNFSSNGSSYADKNVGAAKTITMDGIALSGWDASNYVLTAAGATTQAAITARTLVISGTGMNKVYDGSTHANVSLSDDRLSGDDLMVALGSANYVDKNVGTGKGITISGATLTGADAQNYTVDLNTTVGTGNITARTLNVTATGVNKVYDGTTVATVAYQDDRVNGDVLTYGGAAAFGDKNAGNGKTVTVSGITLGGTDGGNYLLSDTNATAQASITQRVLLVSATAASKVYDGSTAASATLKDNRIGGDALTVSGGAASFADKNAGNGKTVTVRAISIAGADAANYRLTSNVASGSGNITPRGLSFSATGQGKVYDGTTSASLSFGDDRLSGDSLTLSGSGAFADKNVGAAKAINVSGVTLGGADAGNYTLTSTSGTASAAITPRTLHVSASGNDKVYDGTIAASVDLTDDRVGGDALSLSGKASFASKNVGVQQLALSGVGLSGADAGNYTLSVGSAGSAAITPRALTASVTASDKVYDGTTAASIAFSSTALAGDLVQVSGSGAFSDKNAGVGKSVMVSGVQLSGADAGNYTFSSAGLQANASIAPRTLSTSVTASDKVYDGTVVAQFAVTDNRLAGDVLQVGGGSAAFNDKNAGNGKTVTVSGLSLSGADAGNYTLASTGGETIASVGQKDLLITANNQVRDTGAANPAFGYTVSGLVAGDSVGAVTASTSADAQSAAGSYPITLAGADLPNYKVNLVNGVLTVVSPPVIPTTPVDPTPPVTPVDPTPPVTPVDPTPPVTPVDPTPPVTPVDPAPPVTPVIPTAPVIDTIASVVNPVLPPAPAGSNAGFSVPSNPVSRLQLLLADANAGGNAGGNNGSGGGSGNSSGNGNGNNNGAAAIGVNNNGGNGGNGVNGAPAPDEVKTTLLPGGTQIASRNGGIRNAE
ncbi:YDG domain-containing protein [Duganella sp. PWIR1]